jgi:hypothetical protein
MHYDVELLKHECTNNFVTFRNFLIKEVARWIKLKPWNYSKKAI